MSRLKKVIEKLPLLEMANIDPNEHKFGINVKLNILQPSNKSLFYGPRIKVFREDPKINFIIKLDADPTKIDVIAGKIFLNRKDVNILLNKIKQNRAAFLAFWNNPAMTAYELSKLLNKTKEE